MKGVPRPRSRGSHVTLAVWQSHTLILYSELSSAAQPQTRGPHGRSRGAVAQARDTAASGVPCSAHTIGVAVAQAGILPPSRETQNIACAESRGAQHSAARRGARYGLRARGNDARRWHTIPCPGAQHITCKRAKADQQLNTAPFRVEASERSV